MALRPTPTAGEAPGPAFDARALDGLKAAAKSDPKAAAGKVAGQFEALFLQMLLKQMRESLPQDGPLSSDTSKSYTAMFDQQIAQKLSDRGIGLRKALEAQILRNLPDGGASAAKATDGTTPAAKASGAPPAVGEARVRAKAAGQYAAQSASGASAPSAPSGRSVPASVQTFVEKLRPAAEAAAMTLGVPAHYLIAQAGLETGWGRSLPRNADGTTSYNLFGIKAGARQAGSVAAATTEYVGGVARRVVERFRSYAGVGQAFEDFGRLLKSPRYATALARADDPAAYATSLQRAGYATDPQYAQKLTRAIELVSRHVETAQASTNRGIAQVAPARTDNGGEPA